MESKLNARREAAEWHAGKTTIVDVLRERAAQSPDKPVFHYLAKGDVGGPIKTWTYAELDRRARAVAEHLRAAGAAGGRAVLVFPPGLAFVQAFFGCLYADVVAVPVYPPEAHRLNRTLPRFQSVVQASGAKVALTRAKLLPMTKALSGYAPALAGLDWSAVDAVPDEAGDGWERPDIDGSTVAFLQFTSGSTGDPKGVIIHHGHVLANVAMMRDRIHAEDDAVTVTWVPFYHDLGLIGGIVHSLFVGGTSVILSPVHFLQRPLRWLEAMSHFKATVSGAPPFALDLCVRRGKPEGLAGLDLSSLRVLVIGAEPVRARTLDRFVETFKPHGFDSKALFPGYGMAECVLSTSGGPTDTDYRSLDLDAAALQDNRVQPIAAGKGGDGVVTLVSNGAPLPGATVSIVRHDTHATAGPDEVGEIWLRGPHVAGGYWQHPEATEKTYGGVISGREDEGRWLRTGDLGFVRDGEVYVTGRMKDLIVLSGRNLYPQDLELTAESCHGAIRPGGAAAFSVVEDEGERLVIVAEVDPQRGDPEEAAAAMRSAIGSTHDAHVSDVVLVKAQSIPKTSSGKIQRGHCRALYLEDGLDVVARIEAPESADGASEASATDEPIVAPHPREGPEAIARWLEQLLVSRMGLPPDQVDANTALTEVGLDSKSIVELSSLVGDAFGRELPPSVFYDHPTPARIATFLHDERRRMALDEALKRAFEQSDDLAEIFDAAELDALRSRISTGEPGPESHAGSKDVSTTRSSDRVKLADYAARLLNLTQTSLDAFCAIYLYDPTREAADELSLHLCSDSDRPSYSFSIGQGLTGRAFRERRSIHLPRMEDHPDYAPELEATPDGVAHAALFVPVFSPDDRVVAILQATRPAVRPFSEADLAVLEGLASSARPVLMQILLEAQMERMRAMELRAWSLVEQLSEESPLGQVLQHIVDACIGMFDVAKATIFLYDPASDELFSGAGELPEHIRIPAGTGIAGAVFRTGEPLFIRDPYADERFNPQVDIETGFRTTALDTVPLTGREGRIIGVLQLVNRRTPTWTRADQERLISLAGQAARAIDETELYQEIARSTVAVHHTTSTRQASEPIAILGMGCRFPGGVDSPDAFWKLLIDGVDAITEVPPERWDVDAYFDADPLAPGKVTTRYGGFIEGVDGFDAAFFGISPREARSIDPQQRLLMEVAYEALENAGQAPDRLAGTRTGVFAGVSNSDYGGRLLYGRSVESLDAYTVTGNAFSLITGRLSYQLGAEGPSVPVDTACSSSLVAVHMAVRALQHGECDLAIAGGVNLMLTPSGTICFSRLQALASDGRCKTFDASANGYVRSEGCGVVVLKRLSEASRDRDPIVAVIRGSAVNHDGRSNGLTAPSGRAQQAVIAQALAESGHAAAEVSFVEAHGTGTSLGDPIELNALGAVLREGRTPQRPTLVGSVKTNIGHTESAAGVAGLIKAALSLQHGKLPRHLHFENPTRHVPWNDLPLRVPTSTTELAGEAGSLVAGVSSFGIGGTNAHVVLEAAPAPPTPRADTATQPVLVPVSAQHPTTLAQVARQIASALREGKRLRDVAHTLSVRRAHHHHRWAVVGSDAREVAEALERRADAATPFVDRPLQPGRVVFLYPGQGGQWPEMGVRLMRNSPTFRRTIETCERAMSGLTDWSLSDLLAGRADASLWSRDDVIQPALFAMQVALTKTWETLGATPAVVVGHSMGEVAAAHVAGALDLEDACRVICHRSRLASHAPRGGGMMVVDSSPQEAEELASAYEGRLVVAAINGPRLAVLSGDSDAVDEVVAKMDAKEIFARRVRVEYASHSPKMDGVRDELVEVLDGLTGSKPTRAWWSSVEAARRIEAPDASYWGRNLRQPVRFWPTVEALLRDGVDTFVEISPHPTLLAPLEVGCASSPQTMLFLPSLRRDFGGLEELLTERAALYEAGHDGALPEVVGDFVSLPTTPWRRRSFWIDLGDLASGGVPADQIGEDESELEDVVSATPEEALRLELSRLLALAPDEVDANIPLRDQGFDSLMVLQLGARLESRRGLTLPAALRARVMQMRPAEIVHELVDAAEAVSSAEPGPVPLSVGQRWMLEDPVDLHHRNVGILLRSASSIDPKAMADAVDAMAGRHDALRLRLDTSMALHLSDEPGPTAWSFEDLSGAARDARCELLFDRCNRAQESLDLAHGPLWRAAGFDVGDDGARLLVTANHLIVDAYGLWLLLADLCKAYRQRIAGDAIELGPPPLPWSTWARGLSRPEAVAAIEATAAGWAALLDGSAPPLPLDDPDGDFMVSANRSHEARLTPEITSRLRGHARAEDVMLSALLIALSDIVGRPAARLNRIVHGRVDNPDGSDLIRTVGFIATSHPLVFDFPSDTPEGDILESVKRAIDSVPDDGSSFLQLLGLLGSGVGSPEIETLRAIPAAPIRFNFIGDTDGRLTDLEPFSLAPEPAGAHTSGRRRREAVLDVWITIEGGQARVVFEHDERFAAESISGLADRFPAAVESLFSGSRLQRSSS